MTDNTIFLEKITVFVKVKFALESEVLWAKAAVCASVSTSQYFSGACQVQGSDLGGWVGESKKASNPPLCKYFIPTAPTLEIHNIPEILGFCWCWRQCTLVLHPWAHTVHASLVAEEEWAERITPPWSFPARSMWTYCFLLAFEKWKILTGQGPPLAVACTTGIHGL